MWLVVLVGAIFLNPLFVFVGAVALVLAFNLWACRWIDRGRARPEDRDEAREDGHRQVHEPPRPLGDERLLLAVRRRRDDHQPGSRHRGRTHARRPGVGERKILVASLTYAIVESLLWTAIGYGIGKGVNRW
jgi:hypothetical protein